MARFKPKSWQQVEIKAMGSEGNAITRIDNQVVFVEQATPGDIVDIKTTGKKKKVLHGRITHLHKPSTARVDPVCQHFGTCGGCKWQHIDYQFQLQFKQQQVIDALERIAKIPFPQPNDIIGSPDTEQYRNKLEFTFSNRKWLTSEEIQSGKDINRNGAGFHMPGRFDRVVDISECHLMDPIANQIRNQIKEFAIREGLTFFDHVKKTGLLRTLMIRTGSKDQVLVLVQFGMNDEAGIEKIMQFLDQTFPDLTSLNYAINTKGNDTFYDLEVITYKGDPFITEELGGLKFRLNPKSFFQTNTRQTERLYNIVKDFAGLNGSELVFDLYSGTGAIALFCSDNVKKIAGIESVEESVSDARINASINNIENTTFYAGDLKDSLETVTQKEGTPDVVITDPPRAGMHQDVVKALCEIQAPTMVYVSCNPATQARDLAMMQDFYIIESVQPIDLFPHTAHVENVVLLKKKNHE